MIKGWNMQHERTLKLLAFAVGNIVAPHVKKSASRNIVERMFNALMGKTPVRSTDELHSGEKEEKKKLFWKMRKTRQARKERKAKLEKGN